MPYCPLGHPTPYGAQKCPECGLAVEDPEAAEADASSEYVEGPAARIVSLASGLRKGARYLEYVAVVATVIGLAGGVFMMLYTDDESFDTTRPLLGLGITLIISSLVAGLFNWCVARALHLFAEYAAVSVQQDLDDF